MNGEIYTVVDEWCESCMRGVALAAEQWQLNDLDMKILIGPIQAFQGEQASITHKQYCHEEMQNLQQSIAPNVRLIHAYWLAKRTNDKVRSPFKRRETKIGRNDPCSCGSGKKYKRCCLH